MTLLLTKVGKRVPWTTLRSWAAYAALPLVGLVTAPVLARALGPEGRGQLAAVLQPLSVADAFAAIGVPAAMTFFVARGIHPSRLRGPSLLLLTLSSVIVAAALAAYSSEISKASGLPQHLLLLLWASTIIGAYISSRRGAWQGFRRYGLLDGERVSAASTRLVLIVGLFTLGVTTMFPYAVAYVLSGLLAAGLLFRQLPNMDVAESRRRNKFSGPVFARYAVLASLGAISMTLNNRLDQAALPAAVSAHDLGLYSVAVTVAEVPVIIATVMNRNLLAEAGANAAKKVLLRTTLTGIVGVSICCLGIALVAPWLVPLAFGPAFEGSVGLIWLLLGGTVLGTCASALSVIITGRGRPGIGSIGPGISALATAGLLLVFWQEMTVVRAAQIAILAQCLAVVVSGILLVRTSLVRSHG